MKCEMLVWGDLGRASRVGSRSALVVPPGGLVFLQCWVAFVVGAALAVRRVRRFRSICSSVQRLVLVGPVEICAKSGKVAS